MLRHATVRRFGVSRDISHCRDVACRNLVSEGPFGDTVPWGVLCPVTPTWGRVRMVQVVRQQGLMRQRLGLLAGVLTVGLVLGACTVPGGGAADGGATDAPSSAAAPATSTTTTPADPAGHADAQRRGRRQGPRRHPGVRRGQGRHGHRRHADLQGPQEGRGQRRGQPRPQRRHLDRHQPPGAGDDLHPQHGRQEHRRRRGDRALDVLDAGAVQEAADLPQHRGQRRDRRRRHAGHRPVRRAGQGQGRVREEDDGQVRPAAGRLVGLGLQQRGALAAGELLEAGHQGVRQRRHQQRPGRQRHLWPAVHLRRVHRR